MTTPRQTYWLIGAGGTGTALFGPLLRYLGTFHGARKESFTLAVMDGDNVEPHNLNRQLFDTPAIGHNKAQALTASAIKPDIAELHPIPQYLGSDEDSLSRITDGDIILIAVDNYPVRYFIEQRALQLPNVVVINGGNEKTDGSTQIFIRRKGRNLTPPLSHCHPEIAPTGPDRAKMTCQAIAKLPGGEQTIIANGASAIFMLNMLRLFHERSDKDLKTMPHEFHFDLNTLSARPDDLRGVPGWK